MRMGQAQSPFTEWFGLNSDGSGQLAKVISLGIPLEKLMNSMQEIVLTVK